MSSRAALRLAVALCATGALAFAGGIALYLASTGVGGERVISVAFLIVFSAVGLLVVSRQPRNPIGWIFCASTVLTGLSTLSDAYAWYWLDGNGVAWLGQAAAAYEYAGWVPGVLIPVTFLLLLFPDGHLLTPRWRWVARAAALGIACLLFGELTYKGELDDFPGYVNAYGLDGPLKSAMEGLSILLILIAIVASPLSLALRLRRSRGQERQQIKWLVWAGAVAAVTFLLGASLGYSYAPQAVANTAILLGVLALPVATGVAILRYRLYDIDLVINRTLVYAVLTATLAGVYLGSVLLFQLVLSGLTSDSGLAVAASTLAVAALFRPARSRIQRAVDHRFYRRRYDAGQTVEAFTASLRDQVDLGALTNELSAVVGDTLQPAHVSLWLRAADR